MKCSLVSRQDKRQSSRRSGSGICIESIATAKVAAESAVQRVKQEARQHVQSQDNVAIRRLQETLEEQREHFQNRLMQAQQAHEQAIQERNKLAMTCSEGSSYLEHLKTEHQQYVEQNEARFQAAAKATRKCKSNCS